MQYKNMIPVLSVLLVGLPVQAQDNSGEVANPCTIEPVFHCAEPMDDGSYIGHFGYRTSCPESDIPFKDIYIQIGDDNYFAPEPADRGQPKIFMRGEHVDEFEAEFTADEIETGKDFSWTVLKIGIPINFSKTQDASLDCTSLPY